MRTSARRLAWVPPALVGASAAIAAEVAVGILLYAGPGLMRSLTTVLAVQLVAFAAGVGSAPPPTPDPVDRLRRPWLLCLVTFFAAALFGTSWTVLQDWGGTALTQGLGLAVLAGLPLYACGVVLGGMSAEAASDAEGPRRGPGAAAAIGAATGFTITGWLLPRSPLPSSLLVIAIVLLSFGAIVYGLLLTFRPRVAVRARRASDGAEVRVEDHRLQAADVHLLRLLEGSHERAALDLDGNGRVPWDVAVGRALMPAQDQAFRVLVVGGGASRLPRALLREHPGAAVEVLERQPAVVELGREHFDTGLSVGDGERARVRLGNLDDLIESLYVPYHLVVIDGAALRPLGGPRGLSRRSRAALAALTRPDGALVWGPDGVDVTDPLEGWSDRRYRRVDANGTPSETVLVRRRGVTPPWPEHFQGFDVPSGDPSTP